MRKYKKIVEEKEVIDKILCNMCGNKIKKDNFGNYFDYLHIEKNWGYHSLKDGKTSYIDICEDCFDKISETFCLPME